MITPQPPTLKPQNPKLKILYLSQYFPPEVGATQTRAYEMARYLAAQGHRVTMLTEVPNHPSGIIPPAYRGKLWERAPLDGIDVVRLWVWAAPEKGFASRMRFYLSYMVMAIVAGLVLGLRLRRRYDVVYATSPPLFVGLAGAILALAAARPLRLRGARPVAGVGGGAGRTDQPARHRAWPTASPASATAAPGASSPSPATWPPACKRAGIPARKIVLIPNGANVERVPARSRRGRRPARPPGPGADTFVVLYAGIHGLAQGMESLVETARLLRDDPTHPLRLRRRGTEKGGRGATQSRVRPGQPAAVARTAARGHARLSDPGRGRAWCRCAPPTCSRARCPPRCSRRWPADAGAAERAGRGGRGAGRGRGPGWSSRPKTRPRWPPPSATTSPPRRGRRDGRTGPRLRRPRTIPAASRPAAWMPCCAPSPGDRLHNAKE